MESAEEEPAEEKPVEAEAPGVAAEAPEMEAGALEAPEMIETTEQLKAAAAAQLIGVSRGGAS